MWHEQFSQQPTQWAGKFTTQKGRRTKYVPEDIQATKGQLSFYKTHAIRDSPCPPFIEIMLRKIAKYVATN